MERRQQIEARLRQKLRPSFLRIHDESALHIGHWGDDKTSESHFRIEIVCAQFAGLGRLARHRTIYRALGAALMREVHALVIRARAPDEPKAG